MKKTPNLSRAIEGFLFTKASLGRSPNTIKEHSSNLNRLNQFLGDPNIGDISLKHIEQFFTHLQEYRFDPSRTGKSRTRKLKQKSIHNIRISLNAFFNWTKEEFGVENIIQKFQRIKWEKEPIVPLTDPEIKRLLKACDYSTHNPRNRKNFKITRRSKHRDRAIIHVLYDSGIRVGELVDIRVRDMDLNNLRILVQGKGRKKR
jgi:site-specific recombinase XerD